MKILNTVFILLIALTNIVVSTEAGARPGLDGYTCGLLCNLSPSGEDACEGQKFNEEQCLAVGCCEWNDDMCWSAVGTEDCRGGGGGGGGGGEDACEGQKFNEEQCLAVGCCEWNDDMCWSAVGTEDCTGGGGGGGGGGGRRRALASDEQVLLGPEFDDCWEEMYENALYADSSHFSYLAVPKNTDSNCPIIALDNGFSEGVDFEQGGVLAPMLSILHEVPEGVLFLDYSVTLKYFLGEINKLNPVNYVISENEYNIIQNNCATYLLDVAKVVGLDYKDPNTATNVENYVGKSIASNDITVGEIRKAYLEENKGIYHKASFYVWNFAVGDEGMTRASVRAYMNKMVEE